MSLLGESGPSRGRQLLHVNTTEALSSDDGSTPALHGIKEIGLVLPSGGEAPLVDFSILAFDYIPLWRCPRFAEVSRANGTAA
jgi:hypothetical protein